MVQAVSGNVHITLQACGIFPRLPLGQTSTSAGATSSPSVNRLTSPLAEPAHLPRPVGRVCLGQQAIQRPDQLGQSEGPLRGQDDAAVPRIALREDGEVTNVE